MEYLSSIIFQTVQVAKNYANRTVWNTIDDTYSIYPDLKREISINVASFLYRGRVGYTNGVFIIDSIPHCTSGLETSKETKIKKCGFVSIKRASREHKWSIYHR